MRVPARELVFFLRGGLLAAAERFAPAFFFATFFGAAFFGAARFAAFLAAGFFFDEAFFFAMAKDPFGWGVFKTST